MAETLRIGWIGTGIMGLAMAGHVRKAGYPLTIYSRTQSKAQPLVDAGAVWVDTPAEVAAVSDIVFTIVGFPQDVESVTLGPKGILQTLPKGGIVCDMTTSCPQLAARIAEEARRKGCTAADAPVTGGDVGAREASLAIFVGGDAITFDSLRPCLELMGKNIVHCGPAGFGQNAKLANQIAVAGLMFSVCESLLFAQKAGLDVHQWLETVIQGAAGSTAMNVQGRRILKGDFELGFFAEHFLKDLTLCIDACRRMGIVLPGLIAAEQVYRMLNEQGFARKGTQILIKGLAAMSGKEWKV